jgi:hypothetical protein
MWRWTLNWSEVREDIVVGSCPVRPEDLDRIRDAARASAVLSLQTDACHEAMGIDALALSAHARRRGLVAVNVPLRDFDVQAQRTGLPDAVRALGALLEGGHRAYVHCTAGVNRGPLVVLGYLTFVEGLGVDEALALIRRARPDAAPYRDAYDGCRTDLLVAARNGATASGATDDADLLQRSLLSRGRSADDG